MIKASVVIPVYNCEQYIEQCIKSVLFQTLGDLEVICVDDGSTDQSVQIIKRMALLDTRIILFQQENKGPGIARNLGIKKARGKYIAFLDADDYYWNRDSLEQMYNVCETKKVAACASLQWCVNGSIERLESLPNGIEAHKIIHYLDYQMDYHFTSYLFLREILTKKEIYFPSYLRFEDPPFFVKAMYAAKKFVTVDTCLYYYRCPSLEIRFNPKNLTHMLRGLVENLCFSAQHGLDILFHNTVYRLEYEYASVIFQNIPMDDAEVFQLLLQANQIICNETGQRDYINRPLRTILLYLNGKYEESLLKNIRNKDEILLYGAGRFGRRFLNYLRVHGLSNKVAGFVVSRFQDNPPYIDGIPVLERWDLMAKGTKIPIYVTVAEKYQMEVENSLVQSGHKDYELVKDEFLDIILKPYEAKDV